MTTSTKFADLGTIVRVLSFDDNQVTEKLRPAVYTVSFDMMSGFYLTKHCDKLSVPNRVYGSVQNKVSKILRSFEEAERSFGVLLSGDKGSGKTMTSALAANECIEKYDLPVIMVEESFDGAGLVEFVEKIGECVLFMDEFGKKFSDREGDQQSLLTMFDGSNSSRRLVILTENDTSKINRFILERPGRVHYHFRHDKLDEQIIHEYCADRDIPEAVTEQICFRRETSFEFSFDVLQAIVKEYEMFGGDVTDICEDLNIERPLDYSNYELEVLSIEDITSNCEREHINRGIVSFPTGTKRSIIHVKSIKHEDCTDYIDLSVKQIVKKENDVYTFKSIDDEGNGVIVKARQVYKKASAF